jgi:hypothetical protein
MPTFCYKPLITLSFQVMGMLLHLRVKYPEVWDKMKFHSSCRQLAEGKRTCGKSVLKIKSSVVYFERTPARTANF